MSRLVVVSNRVASPKEGEQAGGGLVTGILDALRGNGGIWFGWSGTVAESRSSAPHVGEFDGFTCVTVDLTRADCHGYYDGLANSALWPLFHYRLDLMKFRFQDFVTYKDVNENFARILTPVLLPDDTVWVHDYHLIPMAENLRRGGGRQRLGFFLHTPFPDFGVLSALPHHEDLVRWLCAYDLVGFQTDDDLTAFHDAIVRGGHGEVKPGGQVRAFGRTLRAGVFPISVDPDAIRAMASTATKSRALRRFKESLQERQLIIGVDRLDYSKGLEHRLKAFSSFLERFPRYSRRVQLLQIATATRSDVPEYQALRQRLGALAGDIAGRYAQMDWAPIRYMNRSFSHRTLCGFLSAARVALVTPLRDGMNLVAKEYVAAQDPDDPGVLILSPFAGVAHELDGAIIANPYDPEAVAGALNDALRMTSDERLCRWRAMMDVLRRNDISAWRETFLTAVADDNLEVA